MLMQTSWAQSLIVEGASAVQPVSLAKVLARHLIL